MNTRLLGALKGMHENAQQALSYVAQVPRWTEDRMAVDAIAKRVEQVAEIAKYQFPLARRDEYPAIDWDSISGMRDRLVHDYGQLDLAILEEVVAIHLPSLIAEIDTILGPDEGAEGP
ncbi:MAG: hypothetical protein NVS3B24_23440 [Candidatus Dormibacteria bacterium]